MIYFIENNVLLLHNLFHGIEYKDNQVSILKHSYKYLVDNVKIYSTLLFSNA